MIIPERVTTRWIATLPNDELVALESQLHAVFLAEETQEKRRLGSRYSLLRGPELLLTAWHRWVLANNETRTRGLFVQHRR